MIMQECGGEAKTSNSVLGSRRALVGRLVCNDKLTGRADGMALARSPWIPCQAENWGWAKRAQVVECKFGKGEQRRPTIWRERDVRGR